MLRSFVTIALSILITSNALALVPINLTQWKVADGGNDHWYGVMTATTDSWLESKDLASSLSIDGMQGYLASITSGQENNFVFSNLLNSVLLDGNHPQFNLGAREDNLGNWAWLTGEAWEYTNWAPNEPNSSPFILPEKEPQVLSIWGAFVDPGSIGQWNDLDANNHDTWSIVEFGDPSTAAPAAVPEPATLLLFGIGLAGAGVVKRFN